MIRSVQSLRVPDTWWLASAGRSCRRLQWERGEETLSSLQSVRERRGETLQSPVSHLPAALQGNGLLLNLQKYFLHSSFFFLCLPKEIRLDCALCILYTYVYYVYCVYTLCPPPLVFTGSDRKLSQSILYYQNTGLSEIYIIEMNQNTHKRLLDL